MEGDLRVSSTMGSDGYDLRADTGSTGWISVETVTTSASLDAPPIFGKNPLIKATALLI
jgi:hypothetical protein